MDKFSQEWLQSIFRMKGKCKNSLTREILLSLDFKKTFKIINIVGTNGKGSIATYINDSLISQGFKVGKFTSPHIFKYNERITINNIQIKDDEFFNIVNPIIKVLNNEGIMFFPITYIASMKHFQNNNVDFVILEAGVGGLEDPTNVIDGEYGILTSIDMDHLDWFKTRENIAIDKSGIINNNMTFFLPTHLSEYDRSIFVKKIKETNSKLIEVDNNGSNYQKRNMKLANATIKHITKKEIENYNTPFGRTTTININGHNVVLDVAHNEAGIKETLKLLKERNITFDQVIISLSSNKDDQNIGQLFSVPIYIYEHKGPSPKKIKDYKIKGTVIKSINNFYKSINKNTLIIGSFYLIGELDV